MVTNMDEVQQVTLETYIWQDHRGRTHELRQLKETGMLLSHTIDRVVLLPTLETAWSCGRPGDRRLAKRTRCAEYVRRLTGWHWPVKFLELQPFVCIDREISVGDAKRIYGFNAHPTREPWLCL